MKGEGRKTFRNSRGNHRGRSHAPHAYYVEEAEAADQDEEFNEGPSRDYRDKQSEDSRISRQLRRLSRETNAERFLETVYLLKENVHLAENTKYVKRHAFVYESLFDTLATAPDKECKWELATCIGHIGHILFYDASRFLDFCFGKLENSSSSEWKVLVLKSIHTMIELDTSGSQIQMIGKTVAGHLHQSLENTNTVELMVITVDILKLIHESAPRAIANEFQDLVDILLGWHIDYSQPEEVTTYVSLSLQSFQKTWLSNLKTVSTLLIQFLEDIEDYMLDSVDADEIVEDSSTITHKVAANIGVFTTILRCIGSPKEAPHFFAINPSFLLKSIQTIMEVAKKVQNKCPHEELLSNLDQICVALLTLHITDIGEQIIELVQMHDDSVKSMKFSSQIALLNLMSESLKSLNEPYVLRLVKILMQKDSLLRKLRVSTNRETWQSSLKVYHTLFARKSVSILQEAYQYVLADLEMCLKVLLPHSTSFAPVVPGYDVQEIKLSDQKAAEIFNYCLAILSELANTRNSIITLWALKPSIVELLAIHLSPGDPHWSAHHPNLQENIVHLLYSHCKEHSQFISSSTLVVGKPSGKFIPMDSQFSVQEPFQSSTSTSSNLETVLTLVTALLKLKNTASTAVLEEALEWAAVTIIGCDHSSSRLLHTQQFMDLLSSVVDTGYHFMASVKKAVAQALLMIMEAISDQQIHCTKQIVDICFYHCSHSDDTVRKDFLKILSYVPISKICIALNSTSDCSGTSYSITKEGSEAHLELGHLSASNLLHLQRHYFLHSSMEISGVSFHRIGTFIMQYACPDEDNWMSEIVRVTQRVERLTQTEDWTFSILVANINLLLWKWIAWEAAHFCTSNRLKTCLGKPTDMFNNILDGLKKHCTEISNIGATWSDEKIFGQHEMIEPNYLLKVVMLVEFIESLEKAMFNASDGCAVTPSPTNKSVRIFFSTNRQTCIEWMFCLRAAVMTVAQNTGQPHVALRHSYALLRDLLANPKTDDERLERAVCYCVKVLCGLGCEQALMGFYTWMLHKQNSPPLWIKFAALCAGQRYEEAIAFFEETELASQFPRETTEEPGSLSHMTFIRDFIYEQLYLCDKTLEDWDTILSDPDVRYGSSEKPAFLKDLAHIEALSKFEDPLNNFVDVRNLPNIKSKRSWLPSESALLLDCSLLQCISNAIQTGGKLSRENMDIINSCSAEMEHLLKILSVTDYKSDRIDACVTLHVIKELKSLQQQETPAIYEEWNSCHQEPLRILNRISRYTKLISCIKGEVVDASTVNLDLLRAKISRKHANLRFAQKKLVNLIQQDGPDFIQILQSHMAQNETSILHAKIYKQSAKLLFRKGKTEASLAILSETVCRLNQVLETLVSQDPSLLSLPPNETGNLCARSLITICKWLSDPNIQTSTGSLDKLLAVYGNMINFAPAEFTTVNEDILNGLPLLDANIGRMFTLGAIQCPNLAKIWYNLASWSFKWGRSLLSSNDALKDGSLDEQNTARICNLLSCVLPTDKFSHGCEEICRLLNLGGSELPKKDNDQDLWLDNSQHQQVETTLLRKLYELGVDSNEAPSLARTMLMMRQKSFEDGHAILVSSATAYFRFLRTADESDQKQSKKLDRQMTATLRLLRIIVKHATEMQDVLEVGLENSPTGPWKAIIPQLFARLSHPEPYVRASISSLLCRIAQESPHLIIFPAVVGASGSMNANQKTWTGVMDKYFKKNIDDEAIASGDSADLSSDEEDVEEPSLTEPTKSVIDEEPIEAEEDLDDDQSDANTQAEFKKRALMQNCFSNLVNTLQNQLGGSIAEVRTFIHELRRITVLWDELCIGTIQPHLYDLNKKCQQLKSDIVKLNQNSSLNMDQKEQLVQKKYDILFKPVIFVLDHLMEITSAKAETPHEASFQESFHPLIKETRGVLAQPDNILEPTQSLSKLKALYQALQNKSQKKSSSTLNMMDISPVLATMKNTKIAMPGIQSSSREILCISSVGSTLNILPTKTKPKKLSFQGSDGRKHTYLFKGLEDLHLDQRIMQFLATVNTMFHQDKSADSKLYRARFYSVVPLGPRSGLIQWVDNATPLFGLYKRWQQREAHVKTLKADANTKQAHTQVTHRPSDIFFNKLTPKLKELGVSLENRKSWPLATMKEVFSELVQETPDNLLSRELWMTSVNSKEWWNVTQRYNISCAVMSVIGYVIGLGDRHLDNLLVNLTTGEVVHIDYNVCFEKGKNLRIPEKVPFRMTQNIEGALGVTGVEGVFRSACEEVLQTMRNGKETLLTLLEAFIYDPLIDWTPDNETGYAGAIYGGEQTFMQDVKENRLQLEKTLTLSMLDVRLTEMKNQWLSNKQEVLSAMPPVVNDIEQWKETHQALVKAEEKLVEGHALISLIIGAESNPQHNLYSLSSRHKEYSIVKNTAQTANDLLQANILELNQWIKLFRKTNMAFEKNSLAELAKQMPTVESFTSSIGPVKDHLRKAGQAALASQCEQIEAQLKKVIVKTLASSQKMLEDVAVYKTVWEGYPSNHLGTHRISKQCDALVEISSDLSLKSVHRHMELCKQPPSSTNAVMVDKYLTKKMAQLTGKIQKVNRWMQDNKMADNESLEGLLQESEMRVVNFSQQENEQGVNSVVCALLSCLVQSLKMRLNEDKTVNSSKQPMLTDLVLEDMWWLDESKISLGMIHEVMTQLCKYSPPSSTAEQAVIKSLDALKGFFGALQDLVEKTSQVIVVEGGRLLSMGEESVVNIASDIRGFIGELNLPINVLLKQLEDHLRLITFRMPSTFSSSVQEANYLHDKLIERIQILSEVRPHAMGPHEGGLTEGQMVLMGFYMLFASVDTQIDKLIESATFAVLQTPWLKVDIVRQSTVMMGPIFDPSIRETVRAILKIRKVQAITTFFTEALNMCADGAKNKYQANPLAEEESLTRIVKEYASDYVHRFVLGLPSYLATHLLLLNAQKAGLDVTGYIESRDVGSDGQVPLDGIVEEALDRMITNWNLQNVISTAADHIHSYLTVTKRILLHGVWNRDLEGYQTLQRRVNAQHLSHRWFWSDELEEQPSALLSLRTTLAEISNHCDSLVSLNKSSSELQIKYHTLSENVRHRLKWAAGTDPVIVEALDKFQGCVDKNNELFSQLTVVHEEITSIAKAVVRYENYRTSNPDSAKQDEHFKTVLKKIEQSCRVHKQYTASVSNQEELLISLCGLPAEISPSWIKESTSKITDHLVVLTEKVSQQRELLSATNANVIEGVELLRQHLIVHHKLMSEIRSLLKNLAKFEHEWNIHGIENFLCLYRHYSETMMSTIRQIVSDPLTAEKADIYISTLQHLLSQTSVIYEELIGLHAICQSSEDESSLAKSATKEKAGLFSPTRKMIVSGAKAHQKPRPVQVEEHNSYALSVWKRVKMKLDGRDPNSEEPSTVSEQVDYSIRAAKSKDNLASLFEGWTAWV